ncbi:MAG TPA: hypothetical protein GXX46_06020 [Peptococcaceae bacterium]|nr:hypothetical protein [Peptococcaceae bacterium]
MFSKKKILPLTVLILLLAFMLMFTGCAPRTAPQAEPSADPAKPVDEQAPDETGQVDYSNFKEYTEPGVYTIKYPEDWALEGGGQRLGYEILAFYKADPDANLGPHGGQDPNSAKVAVSIVAKEGKSFEKVIQDYYLDNDLENKSKVEEELVIDGHQALRVSYTYDSPIISMLLDIDEVRYAIITGYHGEGSEKEKLIREIKLIQESFRVLTLQS